MVIKTPERSLSILHWFHVSPFYMAATLTINVIATGLIVEESFSLESHQGGYMYEIGSVCVHLWLQGSCYCHHTFSFLHWGLCFLPPEVFVFWGSHWSHWPCWKSQTGVRMTHTCLCVYVWFTDQADKILSILQSLGGKRETLRFSTFLCPAVHPWIIQMSSLFPPLPLTHIMSSVGIKVNFPLIWMETEVMYESEIHLGS